MAKQIVPSEQMKKLALETITELVGIVKQTLGPGGNPIIIQREGQNPDGTPKTPLITKDGVTVAEAVTFADPTKNTIAQAIIQVAKDTVNEAGDGTTSALVLAEAIYKAGYRYVEQGKNSIQLYEELKRLKDEILEYITDVAVKVELKDIYHIAKLSSNGDEEIARVVQEAIDSVGEDGHITLEEGATRDTLLELVEGAMYKQGYRNFGPLGSLLITDKARDLCEMKEPAILLYNGKLDDVRELAEFIGRVYEAENNQITDPFPLLIIANDFSEEVKNMILQNRKQGGLPLAAIKTPFDGSPNARTGILEDLACLTGAEVAAKGLLELKRCGKEQLGSADRVEITSQETVFFGGAGDEQEILERVEDLKRLLDSTSHAFDKDNIRIRIGKLVGGIAVIKVGGDSELEILEKKDRIEDALCAAKVAIKDGMVPGGGMTLLDWALDMERTAVTPAEHILVAALKAPFYQVIANVGENPDAVLLRIEYEEAEGYDARSKTIVKNMFESGIIDPAKVTKSALENAVSIAGLLLTTGGAVVLEKSPSRDGQPNPLAGLI